MVELFRAREKDGRGDAKGFGNPPDIQKTDVALAALHASYVGTVEMSDLCQFLLGVTECLPLGPDLLAECGPRIHERPIVEFRAGGRLQTISSFKMARCYDVRPNWILWTNGSIEHSFDWERRRICMETYRVVWEIDIDADSSEEAAETARQYQIATDTTATVFDVRDKAGKLTRVDLLRNEV
jgi:hypothetical protein